MKLHTKYAADVWGFFAITHGWTWLFWSVPWVRGGDVWNYPNIFFIYLGGIGPPLAGIIMTAVTQRRAGLTELWWRVIDIRRIGLAWYIVIFTLVPAISLAALAIASLTGTSENSVVLARLPHPLHLLSLATFVLLFGPLPEEIGWRGYVLDQLQARWSALTASLVLGAAWGTWHIPLFFLENYYAVSEGARPHPVWFFYNIFLTSILITWLYNNNRRSVLVAVLFHFVVNFTGEVLPLSAQANLYKTILMTACVIIVVRRWGPRTLSRSVEG